MGRRYRSPGPTPAVHPRHPVRVPPFSPEATAETHLVGLRWGETAGLRRERLRLLERKLDIVETLIEIDGGRLEPGPPKTVNRTVTLPGYVVEVLAAHMARFPSETYIFTSPTGTPLRRHNFGR
jgi:integrase